MNFLLHTNNNESPLNRNDRIQVVRDECHINRRNYDCRFAVGNETLEGEDEGVGAECKEDLPSFTVAYIWLSTI